jgi:hypothetical protein
VCYADIDPSCTYVVDCAPGYLATIADGCYTGECRLAEECEEPLDCTTLTQEESCTLAPQCDPVYEGIDCTCDSQGECVCADWVFDRCGSALSI